MLERRIEYAAERVIFNGREVFDIKYAVGIDTHERLAEVQYLLSFDSHSQAVLFHVGQCYLPAACIVQITEEQDFRTTEQQQASHGLQCELAAVTQQAAHGLFEVLHIGISFLAARGR